MLSYKVDGLEEILTLDSLDSIDNDFLNDLNLKTGQVTSSSSEAGKIIDNYYCYIATVLNNDDAENMKEGNNIKIRLINGDEISAKVYKLKDDGNKKVVIFQINKDVEELIDYRKINFDIIYWSYSGLKIPNSAILEEDNLKYVIRIRAGYRDKILVKEEKKNDTYTIVSDYTTDELKELGWNSTQIINKKSIGLYDEILVNPQEEEK